MASINGVTLKGITNFRGHEGESLSQGNIYLDGVKVGFFSQDSWGGPDNIDFTDIAAEKEVKIRMKNYYAKYPERRLLPSYEPDIEAFMLDIMELCNDEKQAKKYFKKGFPLFFTCLLTDGQHIVGGASTIEQINEFMKNKQLRYSMVLEQTASFDIS